MLSALSFTFTLRLDYATYTVSHELVDTSLSSLLAAVLVVPVSEILLRSVPSEAAFDDQGVLLAAVGIATEVLLRIDVAYTICISIL